jgi:hypothetical protein
MTENSVEDMPPQLMRIIKSRAALKAVHHAIIRVERFNAQYFPFEIKSVGIGGSSIRHENPRDIDLFAEAYGIRKILSEWRKFKRRLNSSAYKIGNLASRLSEIERRATINRMIETAREELLELGFEKSWIENWFPLVRISDIRWGLDQGIPVAYFSENELISRFMKEGWKGKRLEIHVSVSYPEGEKSALEEKLPFIKIWQAGKGIVIPDEKDIVDFLENERNELLELSKKVIETVESEKEQSWKGPEVYHSTIRIIKKKEKEEPFRNLRIEFRKIALLELDEIKELIEINSKVELIETNTKIRGHLKRFALIGQLNEKIENIGYYELSKLLGTGDICTALSKILPRRLSRLGYLKKDITELLEMVTWDALVQDLKKYGD